MSRMENILNYKKRQDELKQIEEKEKIAKYNYLRDEIEKFHPRIKELIDTFVACKENDIAIPTGFYGGFVHLGFLRFDNNWVLGIIYKIPSHTFVIDDKDAFLYIEKALRISPTTDDMEYFLSRFPDFETEFYEYIDKFLEQSNEEFEK